MAYVKDKGANLATYAKTLNYVILCNNLGMFESFDESCFWACFI